MHFCSLEHGLVVGRPIVVECDSTGDRVIFIATEHCIEVYEKVPENPIAEPAIVYVPENVFVIIRELIKYGECDTFYKMS